MGLAHIWNIVWDSKSPFHWVTAAVLFIAIGYEVFTVREYWYSKEFHEIADEVKYLKELITNKDKSDQPRNQWQNDYLGRDRQGKLKQKDDKYILIKKPEILVRPIPRSSLRFVTTLCTAIGVLGTFYGIQEGLQGINLDTSSSEQLMASSKELLVGMKTAFSTSLMGLGSGSVFTLVLFACDTLRQKRRDSLRNQLKEIARLEIADNNSEVIQALSQVTGNLARLNLPNAEAIGQAVAKSISETFTGLDQLSAKAIVQAFEPALKAIYQEQKKISELQQNQGQRVLEELIQELRAEVIEPIAHKLDESAALTKEASKAVQTLHQELGGISQSLARSIVTIQQFQQETLGELQKFAGNLGETLSQFQSDTKGVLEQTSQEINRAVEQSIQGMTAQRAAFEKSANQAADTFRGIREELQTALQQRATVEKQMLQATQTGIIQILTQANTAFQQQSNTITTVGNEAKNLMDSAKDNLSATLGNIDQTLNSTRKTVQDDLTKFRVEYQENLQSFFEQQNNLLENTLGQQRNRLAEVVENLDRVFRAEASRRSELTKEVDKSMVTIRNAAHEVGQLTIATELNSNQRLIQLQELAREIGTQVKGVKTDYSELSKVFSHSLQAWEKHFEKSQNVFFNEADSAMARVCGKLLETTNLLVAVIDNNT